jgi:hypothetical protein
MVRGKGALILFICTLLLSSVYAGSFLDDEESEFNGVFNNTFYNSSGGFIQVENISEPQPIYGTYESEIRDADLIVDWTNISWNGLGAGEVSSDGKANIMFLRMNGNANDENGLNNGTVIGAVNASGKFGSAYYFDGVNDYIAVSDDDSLDLTDSFSMGAWVNFSSTPGSGHWEGIITKGGQGDGSGADHNYFIVIDQITSWGVGLGITWGYEDSSGTNYQTKHIWTPTIGQWYHIMGVHNASDDTMTLYIDGTQVSQANDATATPATQDLDVFIGRNTGGSSNVYYFHGVIDDAFITNRSLSTTEISDIYNNNDYSSSSTGLDLKFQVRTSDDNSSWTSWLGPSGEGSYYNSPGDLNLSNSRYIQYEAYFENITSKLYNVTIRYFSGSSVGNVSVMLDSPADDYLTNSYNINATCSASSSSELANMTLYHDFNGWQDQETKQISGTSNTTSFNFMDVTTGSHVWNCLACDIDGICNFASANRTIIVDLYAPLISLVSPEDNNITSDSTPSFIFNATDERAPTLDCDLLVDGMVKASDPFVESGADTVLISSPLSNGEYTWYLNCSDGINSDVSGVRNITISSQGFWAKANTHGHTTESDGDSSPATYIDTYKSLGYNVLSITDHNPYGGYNNYTECESYSNLSEYFICIPSEEFTLTVAHSTLINIDSAWPNSTNSMANVQDAFNNAVAVGGFAVAAHPSWNTVEWSDSELSNTYNYTGIEIYNKKIDVKTEGDISQTYAIGRWDYLLNNLDRKVFAVAVDDVHLLASEAGYGWIKVYVDELTAEEYVSKMKQGYFYASTGLSMDEQAFEITCDGSQTYHMGQEADCSNISVNAKIEPGSGESIENISLIRNGVAISTKTDCPSSQDCSFSYLESVSEDSYYRLEAIDTSGKQIWSNPIWVDKADETITIIPVNVTLNYPELVEVDVNGTTVYLNLTIDLNLNMSS